MFIRSERCKDLASELAIVLLRRIENIKISKLDALDLINIGLPSEILEKYQKQKKISKKIDTSKDQQDNLNLALLKLEATKKINEQQQHFFRNRFSHLLNKHIISPLMYRRIKNEIISRVKILAKIYHEEKSKTDTMMSEIERDLTIQNIRNKLILSMKDSYNKQIIELSKSNPVTSNFI